MREAGVWTLLVAFTVWTGAVLAVSGSGAYAGIAPDYLLGAVIYFHVLGSLREKHLAAILTIAVLSVAASAGGAVPIGAKLLGYAVTLLLLPPGDNLARRPVPLLLGIAARETVVLAVAAIVLYFAGPEMGGLSWGEFLVTVIITVPGAMGVFYMLSGIGGLLGLTAVQRRLSRPDNLADARAYERVVGRADLRGS
jgi:hypothetical protein